MMEQHALLNGREGIGCLVMHADTPTKGLERPVAPMSGLERCNTDVACACHGSPTPSVDNPSARAGAQSIVRWTLRVIWVRSVMCCLAIVDKEQRNRSESVSLIGTFPENLGFEEQDVAFTIQTRPTFEVISYGQHMRARRMLGLMDS